MNNYSKTGSTPARVVIVGATGYAGIELVRLLARHPGAELVAAMSSGRDARTQPLADLVPALSGITAVDCRPASMEALVTAQPDVVFLATPHEVALELVPKLLAEKKVRVIDLSGAFRFPDAAVFEQWYQMRHTAAEALTSAIYGWPEKNRAAIAGARLVANPGCYATAASTALWPLVRSGVIVPSGVICDAKSGASGAGKGLRDDLHFVHLEGNCKAYSVLTHRHTPEIAEQSGLGVAELTFTPHLLPINRGIIATTYVRLAPGADAEAMTAAYQDAYRDSPFVRLRAARLPEISDVVGTNFCDLGFRVNPANGQAIVVSTLDNLLKGAAGQALQNMNCMLGWPEETGLL